MDDCENCRALKARLNEALTERDEARARAAEATRLMHSGEQLRDQMLFQSIVRPHSHGKLTSKKRPTMGLHTQEERDHADHLIDLMVEETDVAMDLGHSTHAIFATGYLAAIFNLAEAEGAPEVAQKAADAIAKIQAAYL